MGSFLRPGMNNTRDPFNLHTRSPRSPFGFQQSGDYFGLRSAGVGVQNQIRQVALSLKYKDEPNSSDYSAGGMSTAPPNSNNTWQPRRNTNGSVSGFGEKLENIIAGKSDGGLPMYKDKPYNYATSRRSTPFYRRKLLLPFLLLVSLALYWSSSLGLFTKSGKQFKTHGTFSIFAGKSADWDERRDKVRDAFKISWEAYEAHAWGFDEFHPVSESGRQMVANGMGWIIVDALDTMMIMNLTTQLSHAREWISTTLSFDKDHDVNTFETTIRMLGGLLSAHYLSDKYPEMAPLPVSDGTEDLYLEKATDLADRLLGAYDSNSGVPFASVNLRTRKGIPSHDDMGASSTAEAATLQLEMKYLASLTGEKTYWDAAEKIIQVIDDNGARDGLLPIFIYADQGSFRGDNIRLGSRGDSYYEYLIKQYLQTSQQEPIYLDMWDQAIEGVQKHLITYTKHANLTILAERPNGLDQPIFPKMDHLVCFMPGTIALAVTRGKTVAEARKSGSWGPKQEKEMELARQLMKTCWGMYKATATGLSPEIAHFRIHDPPIMMEDEIPESPEVLSDDHAAWRMDYDIHNADYHNLQRPETVESLFYMWRITGDPIYREWGWQMFESFLQHTQLPAGGGFTSVDNVDKVPPPARDNMESFWLAETLKYLYLLFGPDDVLPLTSNVLNTEAHPFPTFELGKLFSTGWSRKPRNAEGLII